MSPKARLSLHQKVLEPVDVSYVVFLKENVKPKIVERWKHLHQLKFEIPHFGTSGIMIHEKTSIIKQKADSLR